MGAGTARHCLATFALRGVRVCSACAGLNVGRSVVFFRFVLRASVLEPALNVSVADSISENISIAR